MFLKNFDLVAERYIKVCYCALLKFHRKGTVLIKVLVSDRKLSFKKFNHRHNLEARSPVPNKMLK